MIHRGSLLTQLFALITLMKHLISPRVLQAARCVAYLRFVVDEDFSPLFPCGTPLTPSPSPSSLLPPLTTRHFTLVSAGPRRGTRRTPLVLSLSSVFGLLFSRSPTLPRRSLITAARLGPFTPVCSWRCSLSSLGARARTITVIYCITGARLYGPLIAARAPGRRCNRNR